MRKFGNITTSALLVMGLALGGGNAMAATTATATNSEAQAKDAMLYLQVLISGLQSDKVEQPVKGTLVGCLYNNSLGKIATSMDKVIAENPGKIHRDNPNELLSVMVRICGYKPEAASGKGR
jgi:hypothetical protein